MINILLHDAYISPRKRAHLNIHESFTDVIQKTMIACCKETYISPHYHQHEHQKELFIRLTGRFLLIIFDQKGMVTNIINVDESNPVYEIRPRVIHTILALDEINLILEIKEGPFIEGSAKEFPEWSPLEFKDNATYVDRLKKIRVGESFLC